MCRGASYDCQQQRPCTAVFEGCKICGFRTTIDLASVVWKETAIYGWQCLGTMCPYSFGPDVRYRTTNSLACPFSLAMPGPCR